MKGIRFVWDFKVTPEELFVRTNKIIEDARKVYDQVAAVEEDQVSYENVLKVLGDQENEFTSQVFYFLHASEVAVDKAIRDTSIESVKKLKQFDVEMSMREDIFRRLVALDKKQVDLHPQSVRYLKRLVRDRKRNGLHLSEAERKEIMSIKKRIVSLSVEFEKNISEITAALEFSEIELVGLPQTFIEALEKCSDTGKFRVTSAYPHYFPVMDKAQNPETRRKLQFAVHTRCIKENTPILNELVTLRHKHANLLGYSTHSAYVCDITMAKTDTNVAKFLSDLKEKLSPLWEDEQKELLELKENDCKELGIPFDGKLNSYDIGYLTTKLKEMKYSFDQEHLRKYFPLPVVTKGLFEIYQTLLGLKFTEIENPVVWHSDVRMFIVEDSMDGRIMGYFYLDLFPREGKFSHAAVHFMQPGCLLPDGTRQVTVAPMLCNFTKPTADKPSLLTHDEVTTYFHEFGHLMHQMCAQSMYAKFYGTRVEIDFLEAPSQMLENWCWKPLTLKMMSGHYETGEPIPDDLIESLIKSRLLNVACSNLRQICLATFDQRIHTVAQADTQAVYHETAKEIVGIPPSEGTNFAATFNHMGDEYDGRYYCYLWSEVYSEDMFQTKFEGNLLDPEVGKEYRKKIIGLGGTKDANDMLYDFLGRKPNQDAFLKSKGLD